MIKGRENNERFVNFNQVIELDLASNPHYAEMKKIISQLRRCEVDYVMSREGDDLRGYTYAVTVNDGKGTLFTVEQRDSMPYMWLSGKWIETPFKKSLELEESTTAKEVFSIVGRAIDWYEHSLKGKVLTAMREFA